MKKQHSFDPKALNQKLILNILIAMNPILLTKLDHTRITKALNSALDKRTVFQNDADGILNEINSALLVESYEIPPDIVTMNSIVKLKFMNQNKETEIQIVYPDEADSAKNKISIFSPIATALIGYRVGDEIEWFVPAGLTKMKIMKIIYQPEMAGEYQL
ncbi:nucleoside diphosphate kinase regulator [Rhodohalobacter halophilus]|uniref:nucleoside diphosphate kinase regulator n=1 Tax=Rhodohalobacter halophilus TaxID=1812810 RepID=UPI00159F238C|nr:nucleoside diphosphate kinase regulator [Rhodohalobacter halophilus]